jgi:DnaJ family protein C protein 28
VRKFEACHHICRTGHFYHRLLMEKFESIVERKIREAMEAGAFDNLRSKGKPIPIDENPFEEASQRMAHHLLRVNGFAPPWIEEASEIDRECERLRDNLRGAHRSHAVNSPSWQRALDGFRRQAKELNRRILSHNLKSPSAQFHKLQMDLEAEIEALSKS